MKVIRLSKYYCDKWVSQKHYSRRPSIFWHGFGLCIDGMIEGVCVYGQPSPAIQLHAFTDRDFPVLELARLVVQTKKKNAASFLVGRSLGMLEKPAAIVSYADTRRGHCGIVYQSTNWIYTGSTITHENSYVIDGKEVQSMSLRDKGITSTVQWATENNVDMIKPMPKHRYFYLCGSRTAKRNMLNKLTYAVVKDYPKADKSMYDDGKKIVMQANEYVQGDLI
jgi:hypothetical protein